MVLCRDPLAIALTRGGFGARGTAV